MRRPPARASAGTERALILRRVVLSDRDIRAAIDAGRIGIDPFDPRCLQPASVDVRLDRQFRVFRSSRHAFIDLAKVVDDITELVTVTDERFILHPGEFVLGSSVERVRLGQVSFSDAMNRDF